MDDSDLSQPRRDAEVAGSALYRPRVFNAKTRRRFFHDRIVALLRDIGVQPTTSQRVLLGRIIQNEWYLAVQDAKINRGEELSDIAARNRFAMENRLRLDLRDLGYLRSSGKGRSSARAMAAVAAGKQRAA